jgi:hypothetical protein
MVDASLRALRRMRRLVDDFFTMERLREHGYELHEETFELRSLVDGAMAVLAEKDATVVQGWAVDVPGQVQVSGDGEMLRRGLRLVLEHMGRGGQTLTLVGHAAKAGGELLVRASQAPDPLVPPVPEERPSGDPTGSVLGYALAEAIFTAHGGSLREHEGALIVVLPKR